MAVWSAAVGIQFTETNDSVTAEVHVVWDRFGRSVVPSARLRPAARTTLLGIRASERITGALVQIREASSAGVAFRAHEVHAIALHEIGHILGLKHRSDDGTFMTSGMRGGTLSDSDVALVRAWYALPVGARCGGLPAGER